MGCFCSCFDSTDPKSFEYSYSFKKGVKSLGKGGFAHVEEAVNKYTKEAVAVKIIDVTSLSKRMINLIYSEVSIMQDLNHVNIVKCYDFYEKPKDFYVVMELMSGGELFDVIASKSTHSEHDARIAMLDILHAIAYLHQQGIVHRDLKPENLLLSSTAQIKLADFGFAAYVQGQNLNDVCGTPDYISPEMLNKKFYGVQVDMWSIGVILYILLCGYSPFQAEKTSLLYAKIKKSSYLFHEKYWNGVSYYAKDIVRKLLVVDPDRRLTASETLAHPWMLETAVKLEKHSMKDIKTFRRFNAKRKLMAYVRTVMAVNKIKKLSKKYPDEVLNPIIKA